MTARVLSYGLLSPSSRLCLGGLSIIAELMEPFALAPTGGDLGLASLAGKPLGVGMFDTGPSDDLILRVTWGKALPVADCGGCLFFEDLKKKDMTSVGMRERKSVRQGAEGSGACMYEVGRDP